MATSKLSLSARFGSVTLNNIFQWIITHPWVVILITLAITGAMAGATFRLSFKTSIYDLVIEDLPENANYQAFKETFGSEEIIRIVIKTENVFDPVSFKKIEQVSETAKKIPGVRRVISLPEIRKKVDASGNWELDKFSKLIAPLPLIQRNLISEDYRTTLVTLVLQNSADHDVVIAAVDQLIADTTVNLSLYQIGMPLVSKALAEFTERDFRLLPLITLLLITIILWALFRYFFHLVMPLACVLFALTWTFGIMAIAGIPLSMLTMIVPVFLIAVGTAYCLHIMAEYRDQSQQFQSGREVATATFGAITFPTVLAVSTTMVGLGSLFINRISAIKEFALFTCIGMICFLIILLTFMPAALSVIPLSAVKPKKPGRLSADLIERFIQFVVRINLKYWKRTMLVVGGFVVFCIFGIFQINVETNPVGYFRSNTDISRNFHDIYKHLSGSFPLNVVVTGGEDDFFEDAKNVAMLAEAQTFLEKLPGVDKTISFADYMKLVNYASNRFEEGYYKLPEESFEVRMLINNCKSMLGDDIISSFMDKSYASANILLLTHISSSRDFLGMRQSIRNYVDKNFSKDLKWEVTGFGMVVSASSHFITSGQIKSLSLSMVLIFGIMFLLFLSYKVGLIAIVPNMFPIVVNFGIMGWFGIELSMLTSVIASVAIGLAIDDTIHYLVRYNREFRKDLDATRALEHTLHHIGRPIIFTTLTIGIGFSVLMLSGFKPTAIFGMMMVITMLSALIGDLILLPTLMMHVELVTLWDLVKIKMGGEPNMSIPIFKGLSRTELHYVLMAGSLRKAQTGEVLFHKKDQSDTMYAVISGSYEVIDYDSSCDTSITHNVQKRIVLLKTGAIIGEMGMLRSAPRSATIVTAEGGELLQINWKMIKRLQWLYPPTAQKFFMNLMRILCEKLEHINQLFADDSLVDDLTGLCNRKSFSLTLDIEVNRAKRYNHQLSLAVLNVKNNNKENEGNVNFDGQILRMIGQNLQNRMRHCDALSRVEVQTFALLFPEIGHQEAIHICTRLKNGLEQLPADVLGQIELDFEVSELEPQKEESGRALLQRMIPGFNDRLQNGACLQ